MNKRKGITIPLVLMIILISSLISNAALANTRSVDIAQFIALGVLIGIIIANLKTAYWNKK